MDDIPLRPQTLAKAREGLFTNHLTLYISVILITALASYGYWLKTRSIFACQAPGYSATRYLAYCGGGSYADYEHGAFAFNLEPPSLDYARKADVLVLGNSRALIAMSNEPTDDWFSEAKASYYLMGFSYNENMVFTDDLLGDLRPRASVFIVNVDDFFTRRETIAAKSVLHDPEARSRYEWKRSSQVLHKYICQKVPSLCGDRYAIFRSRENGSYYRIPRNEPVTPENAVSYDETADPAAVKEGTALAVDFIKRFAAGKCVIFTNAPYPKVNMGFAKAVAEGAGVPLIAPENLDGLSTSDGYHLDRVSADRWSRAFWQAAGPEIQSCIEKHATAS